MKIRELQQPSEKWKTDQLLNRLREQAMLEAERIIAEYQERVTVDPHTPHPFQILDQQMDEILRATKLDDHEPG
jgi:hypothetical protein